MLDNQSIRKRGAPYGNQNARKHSYYSPALKRRDKRDLAQAASIIGLEEEIALIRFKLKSLLAADPQNMKDFSQAVLALNRLMRTHTKFMKKLEPGEALQRAVRNIFVEYEAMGLPIVPLPDDVGVRSNRIINPPGQQLEPNPPALEKGGSA